jgi:photosystem II stability/assembly factor-like uncharacterized protein
MGGLRKARLSSCIFLLLAFSVRAQAQDGWGKVGLVDSANGPAINYVQFFDRETGVIAGNNGFIRFTRNGGTTWRNPKLPPLDGHASEDIVAGSRRGGTFYLLTSSRLLKSTNHLEIWEDMRRPVPSIRLRGRNDPAPNVGYLDMTFVSESEGWVLCGVIKGKDVFLGSYLLYTRDGGRTWGTTDLKTGGRLMAQMYFADRNHGWIVGEEGTILYTDDGVVWKVKQFPIPEGERTSAPRPKLLDVEFKGDIGIIVGRWGTILRTDDGGRQWFLMTPREFKARDERRNLHGLYMVDAQYAWAVGKSGKILVTSNKGVSWSPQDSQTKADLFDVFMRNREEGWAAGANMTVLKYDADDRGRDDRGPGRGRRGVNGGAYHE